VRASRRRAGHCARPDRSRRPIRSADPPPHSRIGLGGNRANVGGRDTQLSEGPAPPSATPASRPAHNCGLVWTAGILLRIRRSEAGPRKGSPLFFCIPLRSVAGGAGDGRIARPDASSRRPRSPAGLHADREHVIGTLQAAFVQGRLGRDEFDLRVGQALASRTYADLAALTADLPAGLVAAEPRYRPARARAPLPVRTGSCAWVRC
jgi:hypothetical protein